ncbi:MAG: hypothetical protein QMD46_09855 [Methanomicrobiales archaeon]|nr:hypothetical protein [Methanomicrobiales archaeon]MDI6876794.1 hypothetical protein [Methanomicrobiales archaeon]
MTKRPAHPLAVARVGNEGFEKTCPLRRGIGSLTNERGIRVRIGKREGACPAA